METVCLYLHLEDCGHRWREELTPRPPEGASVCWERGKTAEQGQTELPLEGVVAPLHGHRVPLTICGSPRLWPASEERLLNMWGVPSQDTLGSMLGGSSQLPTRKRTCRS